MLSPDYADAVAYAADLHRDQVRKGTDVPYLAHLLAVSALVLEAGGDEGQAIAALLHDALEDQGDRTSYEEIERRYGGQVASVVRECSDTEEQPKPPWRERKERYLEHLRSASEDAVLVSAADKLHNATAITTDLREIGPQVWERFNAGVEGQLWYYSGLVQVLQERLPGSRLTQQLTRVVAEMHDLVHGRGRASD